VIIITHRMGILAATNKIAIMQGGALSAFGNSKEIFERYVSRPQVASRPPTCPDRRDECEIDGPREPAIAYPSIRSTDQHAHDLSAHGARPVS
jgi:ABC-type multidrug transport system ATPase subunit